MSSIFSVAAVYVYYILILYNSKPKSFHGDEIRCQTGIQCPLHHVNTSVTKTGVSNRCEAGLQTFTGPTLHSGMSLTWNMMPSVMLTSALCYTSARLMSLFGSRDVTLLVTLYHTCLRHVTLLGTLFHASALSGHASAHVVPRFWSRCTTLVLMSCHTCAHVVPRAWCNVTISVARDQKFDMT
jgi:hypothetical protein